MIVGSSNTKRVEKDASKNSKFEILFCGVGDERMVEGYTKGLATACQPVVNPSFLKRALALLVLRRYVAWPSAVLRSLMCLRMHTIAGCTIFDCKLYHLDEVQKFAKPANKGTNPIGTLGPYEVTFVRQRMAAEDYFCMMQQVDLP